MKVSRERLSVIGRMIGIYREERRGNSQNNWTQIKFCDNICSPNTLKNIESGGIARSQELYEKLLEKLDLKLGEFPVIDEAVEKLINELYIAIEYFDNSEIDSLTAKGIKILENAKDYVYYSELFRIFNDIRCYYLEDMIIDDKKVDRYLIMLRLFEEKLGEFGEKLTDMLRLIVFARIKMKSIGDFSNHESAIRNLKLTESKYSCVKINLLYYYYITRQRFLMVEILEQLEDEFKLKHNLNRLVDVYSFAILMFGDIDDTKSKEFLDKAELLLSKETLSNSKVAEINANIAAYYYNLHNYKMALKYFPIAIQFNHPNMISNCILMADCQNHLNLKIQIPVISKKDMKIYPDSLRIMYQYFTSIQNEDIPAFLRQKMIMKYIVPTLCENVPIEIFRFELCKIIEETNAYKTLFIFDKMVEENRKEIRL